MERMIDGITLMYNDKNFFEELSPLDVKDFFGYLHRPHIQKGVKYSCWGKLENGRYFVISFCKRSNNFVVLHRMKRRNSEDVILKTFKEWTKRNS